MKTDNPGAPRAVESRRGRIQAVADFIGEQRRLGTRADALIRLLQTYHDARVKTAPWTNSLRIAGLAVTCTWSQDGGLIDAWIRPARRRLIVLAASAGDGSEAAGKGA